MKSPVLISVAILASLAAFVVYFYARPSSGIETMGDESTIVAYASLATGIVTLIVAVVGLVLKIVELRANGKSEH